jgi:exodeoxyribonuclease VII small subunit
MNDREKSVDRQGDGSAARSVDTEPRARSFEDATTRLAQIVAELEGGDLPLERSLALFEEGVRVARAAEQRLDAAERRVEELLGVNAKGEPITRPRPMRDEG